MQLIAHKIDDSMRRNGGWPAATASYLAAWLLAAMGAALLQTFVYTPSPTLRQIVTAVVLNQLFALFVGLLIALPGVPIVQFLNEKGLWLKILHLPFQENGGNAARNRYRLFFVTALLALFPMPFFFGLTTLTERITDPALVTLFVAGSSVLAVGASLAGSLLLGFFLASLIPKKLLERYRPGYALFWLLAFPLPWLVVPLLITVFEQAAFIPLARMLYPAALVALVPPLFWLLRSFWARLQVVLALALSVTFIAAIAWTSSGAGFSPAGATRSPLTSAIFSNLKATLDVDRDGHIQPFEVQDCDEGNPAINSFAFDIPDNGIDEDCDGSDDEAQEGLVLGDNESPFVFARAQKFNVLYIMVDALRADHTHFMGYKRPTTPNIDLLAKESLVFKNTLAHYPSTGMSVPSQLTGRYPEYIEWGVPKGKSDFVLQENNVLLPSLLAENGYQTHAFVSAWIHKNIKGFGRFFQGYHPLYPFKSWKKNVRNSSPISTFEAIRFLNEKKDDKPFFLFVHYEDPHEPYVNHNAPGKKWGKKAIDRYDSDIFWTDLWLGILFEFLRHADLWDNTVIVLTADHGEEFKEHGDKFHGHQIYQESIWVPLLIRIPGYEPMLVDDRVGLVDIFPTILDVLGIDTNRSTLQGISLLKTAAGQVDSDNRPVFSMLVDRGKNPAKKLKTIVQGRFKMIWDLTENKEEFYDLEADPGEQLNLGEGELSIHKELRKTLQLFLDSSHPSWKRF